MRGCVLTRPPNRQRPGPGYQSMTLPIRHRRRSSDHREPTAATAPNGLNFQSAQLHGFHRALQYNVHLVATLLQIERSIDMKGIEKDRSIAPRLSGIFALGVVLLIVSGCAGENTRGNGSSSSSSSSSSSGSGSWSPVTAMQQGNGFSCSGSPDGSVFGCACTQGETDPFLSCNGMDKMCKVLGWPKTCTNGICTCVGVLNSHL